MSSMRQQDSKMKDDYDMDAIKSHLKAIRANYLLLTHYQVRLG